ncbi:hypothetical protein RQP46_001631 [Phenoliferia psychrophenolica]
MRCLVQEGDDGETGPCKRCAAVGREAASLKSLEASLQTVLSTLAKPQAAVSVTDSPPEPLEDTSRRTTVLLSEAPLVVRKEAEGDRVADSTTRETSETAAAMLLLHGLPHPSLTPLGLLADASIQNQRKRSAQTAELDNSDESVASGSARGRFGVANVRYFHSGPTNPSSLRRTTSESQSSLALLIDVVVSPAELHELFQLYFEKCHPAAPILDPELHTPNGTAARSPFLLICVCTVASRYYMKREDIFYRKCLTVAKQVAADIIIRGLKSIEIVLGLFLLCQWNQPAERFSEEISFAFSGMAIRMAIDLNLHCKSLPCPPGVSEESRTAYERETRSGERAWLYAYIVDRSVSNQLGKPYAISRDDLVVRNSNVWHLQSGAVPRDMALCGAVGLQKIITRALDVMYSDMRNISGLNNNLDYYRLFLLSFAIQHALNLPDPISELSQYTSLCFESASKIINIAANKLEPSGLLRHAIDCNFVFLTYACCFLLKVISPAFVEMIDPVAAMDLVERGAQALERCAVDATHTPAIYACFLRALMKNKRGGGSGTAPATRAGSPMPGQQAFGGAPDGSTLPGAGADYQSGGNYTSDMDLLGGEELDALLNGPGSFWDNMLMPGFGGPIQGLNGGTLYPYSHDPWDAAPRQSRPVSPFTGGTYDYNHGAS